MQSCWPIFLDRHGIPVVCAEAFSVFDHSYFIIRVLRFLYFHAPFLSTSDRPLGMSYLTVTFPCRSFFLGSGIVWPTIFAPASIFSTCLSLPFFLFLHHLLRSDRNCEDNAMDRCTSWWIWNRVNNGRTWKRVRGIDGNLMNICPGNLFGVVRLRNVMFDVKSARSWGSSLFRTGRVPAIDWWSPFPFSY